MDVVLQNKEQIEITFIKDDIDTNDGIFSAVFISLFTDRRIEEAERPEGEESLRGWWGDGLADVDGDLIGSKLWLLFTLTITTETLPKSKEWTEQALQWFIDDDIVEEIIVSSEFISDGLLRILIVMDGPNIDRVSFRADLNLPKGKIEFRRVV